MTLNDLNDAVAELHAEHRTILAELDAIDAALDAIEARYGSYPTIADVRIDTNELRARLLAMGGGVTVH
jgi:hypothetical protein